MPESAQQQLPILQFYSDFINDWETLAPATRKDLADFLGRLQKHPFDPEIMNEAQTNGDYYAYQLPDGHVIYWKVEPGRPLSILRPPERILILAVEPSEPTHSSAQKA